ncbi:MAG: class I SAM-dependent methyltransferase [gamma proteobacterium symbiont of Taylorina sp.]|nr:class I SAM-dependent methyltransferase [gamma proteobacterium symbiont of Taylorina sp.]
MNFIYLAYDFDNSTQPFRLIQCPECGLAITDPKPSTEQLNSYYSQNYYGSDEQKFTAVIEKFTCYANHLRAKKILALLKENNSGSNPIRILDIGCGRANLLLEFNKMGCECHGVERSAFQRSEKYDGIHFYQNTFHFEDNYFDAIIIWHVLEHLHTPFNILDDIERTLKPGKPLVIAVPNFSSLQARIFRSHWFHLDIPRHLFHFGNDNLLKTLKSRSFTIEHLTTLSLEQNIFGFIQSVFNAIYFLGKPNSFYQILKKHRIHSYPIKYTIWLAAAIVLLPIAFLETMLTHISDKGASLIIIAKKSIKDR